MRRVCSLFYFSILSFWISLSSASENRVLINGHKNYVQMETGNMNIIISVPHNGNLRPSDIPDRTEPGMLSDTNTRRLAEGLRTNLQSLFGGEGLNNTTPYLIYNNLHRIKMDPNRNDTISCTTQVDDCFPAYTDYHNLIDTKFRKEFMQQPRMDGKLYKRALVLDIHGQSHPEAWIELGYLLTATQLNMATLNPSTMKTSVDNLIANGRYSMEEVIRGSLSLGGILTTFYNYKTVPSFRNPGPQGGNYYNGGYITQAHGSSSNKNSPLNAIQIESPIYLRQNDTVDEYARNLASAIYQFYLFHGFNTLV